MRADVADEFWRNFSSVCHLAMALANPTAAQFDYFKVQMFSYKASNYKIIDHTPIYMWLCVVHAPILCMNEVHLKKELKSA